MSWKLTRNDGRHYVEPLTVADLLNDYPDLVAFDQDGWQIHALTDGSCELEELHEEQCILFWPCIEDSENDNGSKAVARAEKENENDHTHK